MLPKLLTVHNPVCKTKTNASIHPSIHPGQAQTFLYQTNNVFPVQVLQAETTSAGPVGGPGWAQRNSFQLIVWWQHLLHWSICQPPTPKKRFSHFCLQGPLWPDLWDEVEHCLQPRSYCYYQTSAFDFTVASVVEKKRRLIVFSESLEARGERRSLQLRLD